jgi:hypothetical protein
MLREAVQHRHSQPSKREHDLWSTMGLVAADGVANANDVRVRTLCKHPPTQQGAVCAQEQRPMTQTRHAHIRNLLVISGRGRTVAVAQRTQHSVTQHSERHTPASTHTSTMASPRSATQQQPQSSTRMLSSFTSQCAMRFACRNSSPSSTCSPMVSNCAAGSTDGPAARRPFSVIGCASNTPNIVTTRAPSVHTRRV